jgi:hypothetical protein
MRKNLLLRNFKKLTLKRDVLFLTLGSDKNLMPSKCPILGHYSGIIPDNENLCTTITSDCTKPDVMYYQVGPCTDDIIFERRIYQCLGEWISDNVIYTYTRRLDTVASSECFVGAEADPEAHKIYIKEAGEICHKNINPWHFGMEMNQLSNYFNYKIIIYLISGRGKGHQKGHQRSHQGGYFWSIFSKTRNLFDSF